MAMKGEHIRVRHMAKQRLLHDGSNNSPDSIPYSSQEQYSYYKCNGNNEGTSCCSGPCISHLGMKCRSI